MRGETRPQPHATKREPRARGSIDLFSQAKPSTRAGRLVRPACLGPTATTLGHGR